MKPIYLYSILLCMLINGGASQAAAQTAEEVVKSTATQVITKLKEDREALKAKPDLIYGLVDELIIPHFDFKSMSKLVLGQNWRKATAAQQESFTTEFRTLLVRTYAKALLEYSDNEITYYPATIRAESSVVLVKTDVAQTGADKIPINYSMHNDGKEWKVVDVAINGVSLVSTYRSSFANEIKTKGLDSLIQQLIDKNSKTAPDTTQSASATN